jgi:hypothetical protein
VGNDERHKVYRCIQQVDATLPKLGVHSTGRCNTTSEGGVYGTRETGGGFGGVALCTVPGHRVDVWHNLDLRLSRSLKAAEREQQEEDRQNQTRRPQLLTA